MLGQKTEIVRGRAPSVPYDPPEDERFWAEVKERLAETERRRRMLDMFSADEARSLTQAVGPRGLFAKIDAEAHKQAINESTAANQDGAIAQAEFAAEIERAVEYAAAHPQRRRDPIPRRRSRKRTATPAMAALGLSLALALVLGIGVFWLQSATSKTVAPSRGEAVQSAEQAGKPAAQNALALKIDSDSADFAARAAANGRKKR